MLCSALTSLNTSAVHRLPELRDPWLPGGQPHAGALHRPVQWNLPVGAANGAQQANAPVTS